MTTPLWCLFLGCFLPFVWAGVGTRYKAQAFGSIDLDEPRAQNAKLADAGGRAVAAQDNAWEQLVVFGAAVLTNHVVTGGAGAAGLVAMVWVASRVVHGIAYVNKLSTLRVAGFVAGMACSVALFVMAA